MMLRRVGEEGNILDNPKIRETLPSSSIDHLQVWTQFTTRRHVSDMTTRLRC
jgi:hypothetical protein